MRYEIAPLRLTPLQETTLHIPTPHARCTYHVANQRASTTGLSPGAAAVHAAGEHAGLFPVAGCVLPQVDTQALKSSAMRIKISSPLCKLLIYALRALHLIPTHFHRPVQFEGGLAALPGWRCGVGNFAVFEPDTGSVPRHIVCFTLSRLQPVITTFIFTVKLRKPTELATATSASEEAAQEAAAQLLHQTAAKKAATIAENASKKDATALATA
jgi:hypothetical protein